MNENSLIGKYRIIEHIGHGGMADVYKALHPELNRVVALKVLNRTLVHRSEMRERFRREARAIAALDHPNIVKVYDFDIVNDAYFMVMEFIEGETLSKRLADLHRRGERMSLHDVLVVGSSVGEALHIAHEQGVLHRDVKPSNIMFRSGGRAVLTDFGVAKMVNVSSDITATGAVAGTPAYMAPEQWTNDGPDRRSDIYSLGVVLYQMATGELPFTDDRAGRLMFKHISEAPPMPRNLCPSIPVELERVILHSLAKDPKDRYQTAQELVDDLREIVYRIESTAATGVFERPSLDLTDDGSAKGRRLQLPNRGSHFFWLGAGAVVLLTVLVAVALSGRGASGAAVFTPDATGTALAARLVVLESTLSATLKPSPESSRIPATAATTLAPIAMPSHSVTSVHSATLSLSPQPLAAATMCHLSMSLQRDINYSSASWWNLVNTRFDKTWQLRNDGACPWPEDSVLVHLNGPSFGLDDPFNVGSLPVGAEIELSVSLQAPNLPGLYEGHYQLQTAAGVPIGDSLSVILEVRPRASQESTAAESLEPVQFERFDLSEWSRDSARNVWRGKLQLWARGGTGQYTWYRDTLDNPLPGSVMEFEWGMCRDFFGSVWVVSGDTKDHESIHVPYPGACE